MALDTSKRYKILACCGCGNGTCQLLAIKLKSVTKRLGLRANVEAAPASVGVSQGRQYDVVVCNQSLTGNFKKVEEAGVKIIGLKNIMSEAEVEEKLVKALDT